ncbi:hypothetical protein K1T71_008107, partial [Dendrolimus kikuchii]
TKLKPKMNSVLLLLAALVALGAATNVDFTKCDDVNANACKINKVWIAECNPLNGITCELFQNSEASIKVDFTPRFRTSKMACELYYKNGTQYIPFSLWHTSSQLDIRHSTKFATKASFASDLYIDESIPMGNYAIKWEIWNKDFYSHICCFKANVTISNKQELFREETPEASLGHLTKLDPKMYSLFLLFAALAALGAATDINFTKCDDVDRDICKVNQVRIEPCGTRKKNRCEVFQNDTETLNFDFTPNFVATTLKSQVSWADKPFNIEPDDACTLTSCPTEVGKQQTFNYSLFINQALPEGSYTIKWKVWNAPPVAGAGRGIRPAGPKRADGGRPRPRADLRRGADGAGPSSLVLDAAVAAGVKKSSSVDDDRGVETGVAGPAGGGCACLRLLMLSA